MKQYNIHDEIFEAINKLTCEKTYIFTSIGFKNKINRNPKVFYRLLTEDEVAENKKMIERINKRFQQEVLNEIN